MFTSSWRRISLRGVWKSFSRVASVMGGISDTLSVLGTVAALFGLTLSKTDGTIPHIPIEDAPFPVRLVIFLAFAGGVGWMLGILVRFARRWTRDIRLVVTIILSIVMAGFVAGLADWLVAPRHRTDLPQELLLGLVGAMFALRCVVENLSAKRGLAAAGSPTDLSLVPLVFTIATAAILIFEEMGAR